MALLTEELQKLDKSTFSLTGNISLQMDRPGSSRGNGEPVNCSYVFAEWLATVLWSKMQLLSINASESFNKVESRA